MQFQIIPVLNGIKFEMTDEGLYLTASDSELTIKSFIEKKDIKNVEALGNIIIQSKFIVDIINIFLLLSVYSIYTFKFFLYDANCVNNSISVFNTFF